MVPQVIYKNMGNFNKIFDNKRNENGPRERDFKRRDSGKRQFGDRERPQMYEAVCSDCGKRCEVPFKPTGDKPIYCSQCFTNHGSSRFERGDRERPRFQDKRMFDAICATCGRRFELPFRPTGEKPVYCNECFDKGGSSPNRSNEKAVNQYKEQFEMLNAKLDRIIKVLAPEKEETTKAKKVAAKKPASKKKKSK